jgi:hypothetical protein
MTVNSDVATIDPAIERNALLPVLVLNGPTRAVSDEPSGNVSDDGARPCVHTIRSPVDASRKRIRTRAGLRWCSTGHRIAVRFPEPCSLTWCPNESGILSVLPTASASVLLDVLHENATGQEPGPQRPHRVRLVSRSDGLPDRLSGKALLSSSARSSLLPRFDSTPRGPCAAQAHGPPKTDCRPIFSRRVYAFTSTGRTWGPWSFRVR